MEAIVCDCHFDEVKEYRWYYKEGYALRNGTSYRRAGKRIRKGIRMHVVINETPDGLETDHINGDKLDNRCSNLRTATKSQNMWNRRKQYGRSKYKGVYWQKDVGRWKAQYQKNNVKHYLGLFDSEEDAYEAYKKAVSADIGEYARLT